MIRSTRGLVAIAAVVLTGSAGNAEACDCRRLATLSPAVATEADLIFAGTAIEIVERNEHTTRLTWGGSSGETRFLEKWVAFTVSQAWRGVTTETVQVAVDNGDCQFPFEPGTAYLVFADRQPSGNAYTSHCFRTAPLASTDPVLEALGPPRYRPAPLRTGD